MSEERTVKWQFYRGDRGNWRWRKISSEGQILASSEESWENKQQAIEDAVLSGWRADQPTETIE